MRSSPPDGSDSEAITAEFPAVVDPPRARDSVLIWVIIGGILGLGALAIFGGGFRDDAPTSTTTGAPARTVTATPSPPAATAPTATGRAPATASPLTLDIAPVPGEDIAVEIRQGGPAGAVLFAGTIVDGARKRITSSTTARLWLSLAWAPSARVRVNGRLIPTAGGTESYFVRADGLTRLAPAAPGTKSR